MQNKIYLYLEVSVCSDLAADAGEDEQEGDQHGEEHDRDDDDGQVAVHGRPVILRVQRRSAVRPERVEPALHVDGTGDREPGRAELGGRHGPPKWRSMCGGCRRSLGTQDGRV